MNDEVIKDLAVRTAKLSQDLAALSRQVQDVAAEAAVAARTLEVAHGGPPFVVIGLTVLALACFVGYYVVWNVTPALHSPLMGVTNAISSVIIVGAMLAAGNAESWFAQFLGFVAVMLASVNIFGGFTVTHRMLSMFKRKEKKAG